MLLRAFLLLTVALFFTPVPLILNFHYTSIVSFYSVLFQSDSDILYHCFHLSSLTLHPCGPLFLFLSASIHPCISSSIQSKDCQTSAVRFKQCTTSKTSLILLSFYPLPTLPVLSGPATCSHPLSLRKWKKSLNIHSSRCVWKTLSVVVILEKLCPVLCLRLQQPIEVSIVQQQSSVLSRLLSLYHWLMHELEY